MTTNLAFTLQDAAALAQNQGSGTHIGLGVAAGEVFAPAGLWLSPAEAARPEVQRFCFGAGAAFPDFAALGAALEEILAHSAGGFMLACLANPLWRRFSYQGQLFQAGRLLADSRAAFAEHLSGRVTVIPYEIVTQGGAILARRISQVREQGFALALLDAADEAQCQSLAPILAAQPLVGGAAWMMPAVEGGAPGKLLDGPIAILSGALDRQSLFQLGVARGKLPFRQIDPAAPDVPGALDWAQAQTGNFIISSSAAPDQRGTPDLAAAKILAEIAAGLATQGVKKFVIAGSDTAALVLRALGVENLTMLAESGNLPWLGTTHYNFLLKPGGFGADFLFLGEFEPQIRLNAAAE